MADAADLKSAGGDSVWVRIPPALLHRMAAHVDEPLFRSRAARVGGMQYNQAMSIQVDIPQAEIEAFCKRHHIRRLALFGSVLRDDFGPESDIDVLVEFEPGHTVRLDTLLAAEAELSAILQRPVDLGEIR